MDVKCDGFINPSARAKSESDSGMALIPESCPFTRNPVDFVRMVMALRRGQKFVASHLGKILNGELLLAEHFRQEVVKGDDCTTRVGCKTDPTEN